MLSKIKSTALQAIIYTCIGYGAFNVTDAIVKTLTSSYSALFILFASSLVSLAIVSIYGFHKYGISGFKTKNIYWHIFRGLAVMITSTMNILALRTLQLDEFYAIVFITPFVLSVMAFLLLKEPLNRKQIYGILAGFVCIIYMVRPGQDLFQIGTLLVGISVFFYTINCLITRVLKGKDYIFLLPFFSSLSVTIIALLGLLLIPDINFPTQIGIKDSLLLLSLGLIGTLGIVFISIGLQKAPTIAVVAPFHYTQMIWGIILGYLLFNDLPSTTTLIGAGGLIITGIYVINQETRDCKK